MGWIQRRFSPEKSQGWLEGTQDCPCSDVALLPDLHSLSISPSLPPQSTV